MAISGIKLHSPQTLSEALKLMNELEDPRWLAGGTDLLVDLRQGLRTAKHLISLQGIKELKEIEERTGKLQIGAMVTPAQILSSSLVSRYNPALVEAAGSLASAQIRSMATIGGNIASAVPSADLPPPLMAAGASVQLRCLDSSRETFLHEFFGGPRETTCRIGEVLTFIFLPLPPPETGIAYQKIRLREANALAVASAAASITLKAGRIEQAAVVLGAVAPTPLVASKTAEFLMNTIPSESLFQKAASITKEEGKPISDIRGSRWYRRELIQVLTLRALTEAWRRAREKPEPSPKTT
jgi:CO/xanthine dehydrogenase FAD-binding subunit